MHFITVHARHIKTQALAGGIQQAIVASALRAKTEVITDQHVAHAEAVNQHVLDESLRRLGRQPCIEGQDRALVDAAARQLGEFVAQRGNTRRREFGFARNRGEIVARMRLKAHHAARHPAVLRLVFQQRQHGLVAAVHAIEVANRQRALRDIVNKDIETLRADGKVGSSLQANVTLQVNADDHTLLASLGADMKFVFITSAIKLAAGSATSVSTTASSDTKCERCWHYCDDVGNDPTHPTICGRCVSNLYAAGEDRKFA